MILTQTALVEEKATIDGGKNIAMKNVSIPIGKARSDLCRVVKKVQSGVRVTLTSHSRPQAMILPVVAESKPWRVARPDDPCRYGDLQSQVMEDWR
jgi:prevent-host-death family protein